MKFAPVSPSATNAQCALSCPSPQEQIDAQGDREVKLQTAWRQRIEYQYDLFREWCGSRGRHGAGDASADASL
eukprot:5663735-Prymnesium_polylepis.1